MTAIVSITTPPRRMLTLKEAAIYCGEPSTSFAARCPCPQTMNSAGKKLYDIKDLDKWLDDRKTNDPDSIEAILEKMD